MKLIILSIILMMILFGCTNNSQNLPPQQPNNPQPTNSPPNQPMSCDQFCPTQPHTQCVGNWKISGTYPNCVCDFSCTPVSGLVDKLMETDLKKQIDTFVAQTDGRYETRTYYWLSSQYNAAPGEVSLGMKQEVKFNDKTYDSLLASGIVIFTNLDTSSVMGAYGNVIFKGEISILDQFMSSVPGGLRIQFVNPSIGKTLGGCKIISKYPALNPYNEKLTIYQFSCSSVAQ